MSTPTPINPESPTELSTGLATRRGFGRSIRRAVVGAAIVAAVGLPVAAGALAAFDDVPDDHPHNDGIGWLVDNGITLGCDADSFCPSDTVNRGQMGSFLHRLSGHAPGVAPSVDADTVDGKHADELGGLSDVTPVEAQTTLPQDDDFTSASVTCPAGQIPISGGYTLLNGPGAGASLAQDEWFVVSDQPTADGWTVAVRHEADGPAADRALVVRAMCATA